MWRSFHLFGVKARMAIPGLAIALPLTWPLPAAGAEPAVPAPPTMPSAKAAKHGREDTDAQYANRYRDMREYERDWPKVSVSADGKTIYLTGVLPRGSYYKLLHAMRIAPNARTLYLASPGGLTAEGRMIAGLVRRTGLSTYVEQQCASACTQIFVAGRERIAGPRARIGFHQSYLVTRDGQVVREGDARSGMGEDPAHSGEGGNRIMRNGYRQAGIAPDFIDRAMAVDPETTWFPAPAELLSARVITRRTTSAELPPPPGYGQSREATLHSLSSLPLWHEFATGQPQIHSEAVDEVWREVNMGVPMAAAQWRGRQRLIRYAMAKQRGAPDALLDRFAQLYGEQAVWEKTHGYPACSGDGVLPVTPGADDLSFARKEDRLVAELLANSTWRTPLTPAWAREQFASLAARMTQSGKPVPASDEPFKDECRAGMQTIEAIAALAPALRVRAWRAMVSIPAR